MEDFIEAVKALGVGGGPVLAFLWWLERLERKECQKAIQELLEKSIDVTHQSTIAVASVTAAFNEMKAWNKESLALLVNLIEKDKRS